MVSGFWAWGLWSRGAFQGSRVLRLGFEHRFKRSIRGFQGSMFRVFLNHFGV